MDYDFRGEKEAYERHTHEARKLAESLAGATLGAGNGAKQLLTPPIRERVQDALKRASQITSNLSFLADNVTPQSSLNDAKGLVAGEHATDSTLTSEVGDLLRELGRIEHQVQRLSLAITG